MTPDNTYVHILHESHHRKPLHGGLHDIKESRLKTEVVMDGVNWRYHHHVMTVNQT